MGWDWSPFVLLFIILTLLDWIPVWLLYLEIGWEMFFFCWGFIFSLFLGAGEMMCSVFGGGLCFSVLFF